MQLPKTQCETLELHLYPAWYISYQNEVEDTRGKSYSHSEVSDIATQQAVA